MSGRRTEHRQVYRGIPTFECKAGCSDCCGPVPVSEWEAERLGIEGPLTPVKPGTMTCAFVKEGGGCEVYDRRPFICRLFGTADEIRLTCRHGCRPKKLLTKEQAAKKTNDYMDIPGTPRFPKVREEKKVYPKETYPTL